MALRPRFSPGLPLSVSYGHISTKFHKRALQSTHKMIFAKSEILILIAISHRNVEDHETAEGTGDWEIISAGHFLPGEIGS
jgi:hypothetical protein